MAAKPISPLSQRDSELVHRIRAGERQLFHELVRPYERAIFITAYGILRDHADAEEASQETILKAILHLNQLADPDKFKGWLLQIAINEARLKRRARHAALFEPLDGTGNSNPEEEFKPRDFADWRELPSDNAERNEIRQHIARALHALPDIYQETLILRDVQQLSAADAASILGITIPAVKVRLHRARLMMRESLAPVFGKPKTSFWERLKGTNPWSAAKR